MVIVMAVCFFFGYRHYIAEAEINSMSWKVSLEDVMFRDAAERGLRGSFHSLVDMNPATGRFEIVAHFLHNRLEFEANKEIHWAGEREEAPPDRPTCGYDGALCPDNCKYFLTS